MSETYTARIVTAEGELIKFKLELNSECKAWLRFESVLARRAAKSKKGIATSCRGAVKVTVLGREDPRQTKLFKE